MNLDVEPRWTGTLTDRLVDRLPALASSWSTYVPMPERIIRRRLHDDEHIVHVDRRPLPLHAGVRIITLAILLAIGVALYRMADGYERSGWALWLTLILPEAFLARAALGALRDHYTVFVITNLRLMRIDRVVWPRLNYLPWSRVIGVSQRGTRIHVESASRRSGLQEIAGLARPVTFYRIMLDTLRGERAGRPRRPHRPPSYATRWRKYFRSRFLGDDPEQDQDAAVTSR